jgi:hypothetical protein
MALWSGSKVPLRHRQRHHEAKCRWNTRRCILVTLTVAFWISLTSLGAFWATSARISTGSNNGSSYSTSESASPRIRGPFKGSSDGGAIPSKITTDTGDDCIPPKRSRGLEHIQVVKPSSYSHTSSKERKILCFLMTDSSHHTTKVKAVWDTWGTKCDKLLIASNQTDPFLGAVAMKSDSSYSNLWGKLEETIRYIHCHYLDEYDWFVKVDDDSYILMENLRYFVSNIPNDDDHRDKPLIYGRRYSYPPLVDLPNEPRFLPDLAENAAFRKRILQRVHDTHSESRNLIYTQGGAQVMNHKYLRELVQALDSPDKVFGTPPEGMSNVSNSHPYVKCQQLPSLVLFRMPTYCKSLSSYHLLCFPFFKYRHGPWNGHVVSRNCPPAISRPARTRIVSSRNSVKDVRPAELGGLLARLSFPSRWCQVGA